MTEPLRVSGPASTSTYRISYFDEDGTDITAAVTAGTYETEALAPGATTKIKVTVKAKPGAPVGATIAAKVKVTSTTDSTKKDAVKMTVTRSR